MFEVNGATNFAITDTKRYVPVVTLSTQESTKLLQQLKSEFTRKINWNNQSILTERPNEYLDCLINTSFEGIDKIFALSFGQNIMGIFFQK